MGSRLCTADFEDRVYALVGKEYTVLGEYTGSLNKISMRHNLCGHTYEVKPSKFIHDGNRCPYCAGNRKKQNTTQFKARVYSLSGDEYTV